jgi:L-ascorbate metabolism protein UlaG (beta-lactamase superfamily)
MKFKNLFFYGIALSFLISNCKKDETTDSANCTSAPVVYAGIDTIITNNTSCILSASSTIDSGEWTVISGEGGVFDNNKSSNATFTGVANSIYLLKWESANECGLASDTVSITLLEECLLTATAKAGNDITIINANPCKATLRAKKSGEGTGNWTIISGTGATFDDASIPNAILTGQANTTYSLVWTVTNGCSIASDTVNVSFTTQECGTDIALNDMVANIHWFGNASVKIDGSPYKIYIDPVGLKTTDEADIIFVTHSHGDHFSPSDINKIATDKSIIILPSDCSYTGKYSQLIKVKPGDEITINGCVNVKAVAAYNVVKTGYHPKSNNWVGYVITMNGITIYHAGDTERIPEMKDFTCDIAMLPLGQVYTMNSVAEAAEAAKDVQAKVAIPIHYPDNEGSLADAQTFKTLLDGIIDVTIKTKE